MRLLVAFLLAISTTGALAQVTPTEFTNRFVSQVEELHPDVAIVVTEPLHLTATSPSGEEVVAFLGNAYELYRQDEDQLDDILDRYVASLVETFDQEDEQLSIANIVPVVKDSGWLDEAIGAAFEGRNEEAPEYYHEPLVSGLTIIYAEDTPTNIRYIEKDAIADAGADIQGIPAQAVDNLLAKLPGISIEGGGGLYMVTADGTYEASLLLVDELWTPENFAVDGEIVVALPARDVLLVAGTNGAQQLEKLIALSTQVYTESPYYLTQNLYVRRDGRWELFDAPRP